jgi:hypothetical protein
MLDMTGRKKKALDEQDLRRAGRREEIGYCIQIKSHPVGEKEQDSACRAAGAAHPALAQVGLDGRTKHMYALPSPFVGCLLDDRAVNIEELV